MRHIALKKEYNTNDLIQRNGLFLNKEKPQSTEKKKDTTEEKNKKIRNIKKETQTRSKRKITHNSKRQNCSIQSLKLRDDQIAN